MSLVKLCTARDSMQAHHLRALLEAAGIEAVVFGDALLFVRSELPLASTQPAVWVREDDREVAEAVLAEWDDNAPAEGSDDNASDVWTCPSCGETVEAQFTQCWNCETEREATGPDADG